MLAPGILLQGRYRIIRRIGQGGMGAVYEAEHEELGHIVALKETFHTDNEMLRKAFKREARLLAGLRHPALPKVTDYFMESDGLFLVMEHVSGFDLAEMLKQRGAPFPVADVVGWGLQLLDVIHYLHGHVPPILHRDIKPSNIKLTSSGQIMLLDFGLAKGAMGETTSIVTTRSVLGFTLSYSPLEQILRADPALMEHLSVLNAEEVQRIANLGMDQRSDLYSVGATLYHLLTNKVPVQAPTRALSLWSGRPDSLLAVNEVIEGIPQGIADVLKSAMALASDQRPFDAMSMRSLLIRATEIQKGPPRPDQIPTVIGPPVYAVADNQLGATVRNANELASESTQGKKSPGLKVTVQSESVSRTLERPQRAEKTIKVDFGASPADAYVRRAKSDPGKGSTLPYVIGLVALFFVTCIIVLAYLAYSRVRSSMDVSIASPTPSASTRPTPLPTRTPTASPTKQPSPIATSTPSQSEVPNIFKAQPDQSRVPSNVFQSSGRNITGMMDLSGTYKFDKLIGIESDTPFGAGDYSSRKDGNNFYVVIHNASLRGNSKMSAGGAIDGADLQQRQGDVVLTVRMKDGVKTWVWRNEAILLVQIGLKK
jgi:serine/threonine protein kinase